MSLRKYLATAAIALSLSGGAFTPAYAADDHIINMQDVDIKAFIENVGIVTGRTFVIDPRVNGKVNIVSEKPLNDAQVFAVFKEVMRVHGYTVVRAVIVRGKSPPIPMAISSLSLTLRKIYVKRVRLLMLWAQVEKFAKSCN